MERETVISALLLAFLIASLYSAVLVVVKEENEGVYDTLKSVFGHHWVGHGITTLIVFAIFFYLFKAAGLALTEDALVMVLWIGVILNLIIIGGYMLLKYMG